MLVLNGIGTRKCKNKQGSSHVHRLHSSSLLYRELNISDLTRRNRGVADLDCASLCDLFTNFDY